MKGGREYQETKQKKNMQLFLIKGLMIFFIQTNNTKRDKYSKIKQNDTKGGFNGIYYRY